MVNDGHECNGLLCSLARLSSKVRFTHQFWDTQLNIMLYTKTFDNNAFIMYVMHPSHGGRVAHSHIKYEYLAMSLSELSHISYRNYSGQ